MKVQQSAPDVSNAETGVISKISARSAASVEAICLNVGADDPFVLQFRKRVAIFGLGQM